MKSSNFRTWFQKKYSETAALLAYKNMYKWLSDIGCSTSTPTIIEFDYIAVCYNHTIHKNEIYTNFEKLRILCYIFLPSFLSKTFVHRGQSDPLERICPSLLLPSLLFVYAHSRGTSWRHCLSSAHGNFGKSRNESKNK